MHEIDLEPYIKSLDSIKTYSLLGEIKRVRGLLLESAGPPLPVGGICDILLSRNDSAGGSSGNNNELKKADDSGGYEGNNAVGENSVPAEVVGFEDKKLFLMPLGELRGVGPGTKIRARERVAKVGVGQSLLGRVLNGIGEPIDENGPINIEAEYPLYAEPLNPMERPIIDSPLDVGVRAINACLTLGKGQRVGIMAGSGVGKSTLLGMIARHTRADVNVIALIGERGRELKEFIERDLGDVGMRRSVVVVATSDQPPLIRLRGAYVATAIAEYFRDQGKDVILMMDSITRFAMAYREVSLSIGEPPTSRGYTPTVFAQLPRLLERAGTKKGAGTITGIYTVLVEGDDVNEPIGDAVRSIVDGHIALTRDLAQEGHYPPIDVLQSVSRVMRDIQAPGQVNSYEALINCLATYKKVEDLVNLGAYKEGSNQEIDYALKKIGPIRQFLRQRVDEKSSLEESIEQLISLFQN